MVGAENGGCGRKSFAVVDDVANNLESHLRCVHCREFFDADARKPRFLACFHSICESCVSCWLSERNLVVCRSCGCRTDLPGGELEDLAPNEWAYGNLLFFSRSKLLGNLRMMDLPRLLSSLRQSVEDWAPFGDDFESVGEADGSVEDVAEVVDGSGNDGSRTREGQVAADTSRPGVVAFNDDVIRHALGVPLIRGPGMDLLLAQQQPAVNRAPDPDRGMTARNRRRSPPPPPPEAASAWRFDRDPTEDGDHEAPPPGPRNWRRKDSSDEDSDGGRGSVVSRPTRRTTSRETKAKSKDEKSYSPRPRQQREAASKKGSDPRRDEDEDEDGHRSEFDSDLEEDVVEPTKMAHEVVAVLESYLRCVECRFFFNSDERRPRLLRCRRGICDPCARDELRGGSFVTCRDCGCRTEVYGTGADAIEKNNVVEGIVQFFTPSGKGYTDEEASVVLPRMLSEARIAVESGPGRLLGRRSGDTYPPVGERRGRARPNGPEEGQFPASSAAFSRGLVESGSREALN